MESNPTEGETLQNSILNLQRKYFLDIKQTPKTITSVTEYFLRNLDEIKLQGLEMPELRQKVRRVLTESFDKLKKEGESVNFENIKSKLAGKYGGANEGEDTIIKIMKKFVEEFNAEKVGHGILPISFVGNPKEEIVKKEAKNFLCVLGTFLTKEINKKINEINDKIKENFNNKNKENPINPLKQQYTIKFIKKSLAKKSLEEITDDEAEEIINGLFLSSISNSLESITNNLMQTYIDESKKGNFEKSSKYYELLLKNSIQHKIKEYFNDRINEYQKNTNSRNDPFKEGLIRKIENNLLKISSGDYELAPITFSEIIYRLIQKNSLLGKKYKFSEEEIGFLKSLDEKNRNDFLNEVKKEVESHTKNLLYIIKKCTDSKQPSDKQIDEVIKKLDDFSIIGVNPAFSEKEDVNAFFQFMEKVVDNYINDYKSKSCKIPKLIDILVKNFMYDYDPEKEGPEEKGDTSKEGECEEIRMSIHKKAISIIAELVNEYLGEHGEKNKITDSTFIRNLVFLTDYCKLLDKFRTDKISPKIFDRKIQLKESPIKRKLMDDLGLGSNFDCIEEYSFFLDPRIGYKEVEGNKQKKIYSVAAITAFQMDVDVLATKNNAIFGDLVEIEGPTHYLYGFGEMGDKFLHPQTIIRNKIRDSMHKLEYEHPVILEKFAELLEESNRLKNEASKLAEVKKKLQENKRLLAEKYKEFVEPCHADIHINTFFRTFSVFVENINIKDFIENEKEIKSVEQKLKGLSEKQKEKAGSITASQSQRTSLCIGRK